MFLSPKPLLYLFIMSKQRVSNLYLSTFRELWQCRRCKKLQFDPRIRKIPEEGNGNLLQYSCLENPIEREAWRVTVHGVKKESDMTEHVCAYSHTQFYWWSSVSCSEEHSHPSVSLVPTPLQKPKSRSSSPLYKRA